MKQNKIALVVPFFGAWPEYLQLFLLGCEGKNTIDVYLLSETVPPPKLPRNVRFVAMEKKEVQRRLEKETGLELDSLEGHKLCDFRPFFGLGFQDLICNYEFWGYCDIDLLFGDLDNALKGLNQSYPDAFSAHSEQFVGHFTFLRNRPDINRLGFDIPDWRKLCVSPIAEHVDEERFSDVLRNHPQVRWWRPDSLERELRKPFCRHAITFAFGGRVADMASHEDAMVSWDQGRLWVDRAGHPRSEILYVHFMGIKHPWHWPRGGFPAGGPHVFSKLGYGRIQSVEQLKTWQARWLYGWQTILLHAKVTGGKILKKVLPPETIRTLRRKIGV